MGVQGPLYLENSNQTDWRCCHCSEWVCKDHCIKKIQIKQTGNIGHCSEWVCKDHCIKKIQIKQTGNFAIAQNVCAITTVSIQFSQNVTAARNNITGYKFISLLCPKLYFLSSYILRVSLYIIAREMRNMNKRNILTTIKSINRTLKKGVERII